MVGFPISSLLALVVTYITSCQCNPLPNPADCNFTPHDFASARRDLSSSQNGANICPEPAWNGTLEGRPIVSRRLNIQPILRARTVRQQSFDRLMAVALKRTNDWVEERGVDHEPGIGEWMLRVSGLVLTLNSARDFGRPFTYGLMWEAMQMLKTRFSEVFYKESMLFVYDYLPDGGEALSAKGFCGITVPRGADLGLDPDIINGSRVNDTLLVDCDQVAGNEKRDGDDDVVCLISLGQAIASA